MATERGLANKKTELPQHNYPPVSTPSDQPTSSSNTVRTSTPDQAENISLGLLLSDITSLILLSLSTEKFLEKTQEQNPSTMFSTKASRRETFQLLEAAGSTIDVLYDLMEREHTSGSNVMSQACSPETELDSTLVRGRLGGLERLTPTSDTTDPNSTSSGGSIDTIREGVVMERSTSTKDLGGSMSSSRSDEYLSCESEMSKSAEEYRSCEQLIPSLTKQRKDRPAHLGKSDIDIRRNTSTHSLSYLDRRSTVDSGIASPHSLSQSTRAGEASNSKDDSYLFESPQHHMEQEVVNRVQKLKLTVDQKLRDSLANLSNWYSEDYGTASLREHVKTMKIRYEKATTEEWETGAMHDVIMDKALATSVLAMENAQLGNEVNSLRQELQVTYEQAKGHELKGLFVSRFSENLKEMKLRDGDSDSEDSSSEMSTPDTQLLNASYARGSRRHLVRDEFDTPVTGKELSIPGSSGKRRLKVPADLKGHSYPSVSRSGSSMSGSSSGSSGSDSVDAVGCCSCFLDCFSTRRKRLREELLPEADKE